MADKGPPLESIESRTIERADKLHGFRNVHIVAYGYSYLFFKAIIIIFVMTLFPEKKGN